MEEKKYYIRNIETDELEEVTREIYDRFHATRRQYLQVKGVGKPFIASTIEDMEGENDDFMNIWNTPSQS